ncbi:hypothetical protein TEA_012891 [Camellia sinensis var. sinensis]|uniref:Uncharacterized protein n=1 Tax=Camellia sinensis var. sinensis TaxID=542762 RepID=A0A4S4DQ18_CAMSN|nr:hypothetical protein TEA_012891 [Camellia sinensis var. sinensis]
MANANSLEEKLRAKKTEDVDGINNKFSIDPMTGLARGCKHLSEEKLTMLKFFECDKISNSLLSTYKVTKVSWPCEGISWPYARPTMTLHHSSIFMCINGEGCKTCWCPCITFGQIAEIVDEGKTFEGKLPDIVERCGFTEEVRIGHSKDCRDDYLRSSSKNLVQSEDKTIHRQIDDLATSSGSGKCCGCLSYCIRVDTGSTWTCRTIVAEEHTERKHRHTKAQRARRKETRSHGCKHYARNCIADDALIDGATVNHQSTRQQIRDYKGTDDERMEMLGGCSEVQTANADSLEEKLRAKKTEDVDGINNEFSIDPMTGPASLWSKWSNIWDNTNSDRVGMLLLMHLSFKDEEAIQAARKSLCRLLRSLLFRVLLLVSRVPVAEMVVAGDGLSWLGSPSSNLAMFMDVDWMERKYGKRGAIVWSGDEQINEVEEDLFVGQQSSQTSFQLPTEQTDHSNGATLEPDYLHRQNRPAAYLSETTNLQSPASTSKYWRQIYLHLSPNAKNSLNISEQLLQHSRNQDCI